MKIRKISILLLLLGCTFAKAQSDKTKKADKYYHRLEYVKAAEEYLEVALDDADPYVYTQLANSYYHVFNTAEAERWYAKAIVDNNDPEVRYRYAEMLKANGKYQEYNTQMKAFAKAAPSDQRAKAFMENPDYIPQLLAAEQKFEVTSIDINSAQSDFGGYFNKNTFYFTSARDGGKKYGWTGEPYLDIYTASYAGDSFTDVKEIGGDINTRFHEGTVAVTADGQTMYFARTNYNDGKFVKDSAGIGLVNLFKATMTDGKWDNVERLPFNGDNYTTQHPALSEDGSTLYFASDRPGGYGESDLYQVSINEDGTFGTPENLGNAINTEANEGFPFVSADLLYFASNGQLGLGGLDLFVAPIDGASFGSIRNLGVPINSSSDDFSFTFDADTQTGFFSSNREGGKGSDDIYKATQISAICDVDYVFTVTDAATGEILSGAVVSLADADGNKVGSKTTDANGTVAFKVNCNTDMVVEVTKAEYESAQQDVAGTDEAMAAVGVALEPIEVIITEDMVELNPIFFEFDKHNITKEAAFELDKLVEAMNKYPELNIKVETHTDRRGSETYNQTLSEKRAKSTVQYLISKGIAEERLTSEGKGETSPIVDCTSCTKEQHAQNRRSEFLIVKE